MDLEMEIKAIEHQVEYLFFKLDDLLRRLREVESKVDLLERKLHEDG